MTDQQLPDRNGDVIADIAIALTRQGDLSDEHRAFYLEVFDRFEALTSERDRLRTAWESARQRATRARAESEQGWETVARYGSELANLRKELRAESARVSAARDERDQALRAAREVTGRLPEEDMLVPGDEVPDLAELRDLVERLAIDQAETTKAVTQRLATVEDRLGITDDDRLSADIAQFQADVKRIKESSHTHTHTDEGSPARYRDRDGDLWEESLPGHLFLSTRGMTGRPYAVVADEFGPLTPVTTETTGGAE